MALPSLRFPRGPLGVTLAALVLTTPLLATRLAAADPSQVPDGNTVAGRVPVHLSWHRVTSGLNQPLQVVSARDRSSRLFIVEKPGLVRIWSHGRVLPRPYLNITRRVSTQSERGLLSLAFPPNFATRPYVYADYTRNDGDIVVARFRASGMHAGHLNPATGRTILRISHRTYSNHNGGQLMFGPDGMLYIGVGDGGGEGDPIHAAQNRLSLFGKILRIDVNHSCGALRYCVPPGNPFAGTVPGRGEIWLMGLRNPWRFSFDAKLHRLWIGDVGQDAWEEIDRVGNRAGGSDLGWSCWEANTRYNSSQCRPGVTYRFPLVAIPHPQAEAIVGGYVYRGHRFPRLDGTYVFGDNVTGRVWTYRPGQSRRLRTQRLPSLAGFGVDDYHEIWAVTLNGGLWRMQAH